MRYEINYTEYKKTHIDEHEANRIALEVISNITKVPVNSYIKDKFLCIDAEYHTSHSWTDTEELRTATEFDKFLVELYGKLK